MVAESLSQQCRVQARFFRPPDALRPYFTTFYHVELEARDGGTVVDFLHPEWANLRFIQGSPPHAEGQNGAVLSGTPFCATGPSSRSVRFSIGPKAQMWGIGFLPLGWARFVGTRAADLADALADGMTHPVFAPFVPLARSLVESKSDLESGFQRIAGFFLARPDRPIPDEARILAIHTALIDPEVDTVTQLVERVGTSQRTVERVCARAFGFSPKLLLRRQRFLRSLADYVLDPSLNWIGALDAQYHDQAQFVRDFKQFMGISPRQYAAMPKPILGAIMHERARFAGKAVQALDGPAGGAVA